MPRATKPKSDTPAGPRLVRKAPARATASPPVTITHALIAIRAYELFEASGAAHGNHVEHWLKAEQELIEAQRPRPVRKVAGSRAKA